MTLSAMDIAKLLLVEEERGGSVSSVSPGQIPGQPSPTEQKPSTVNLTGVIQKEKFTLKSQNNVTVPESGKFLDINTDGGGATIHIRQISFSTTTEWKDLKISIDTKLYQEGDFAFFEELGYAWYDGQTGLYNLNILKSDVDYALTMSIDSGITLNSLIQDYYIK